MCCFWGGRGGIDFNAPPPPLLPPPPPYSYYGLLALIAGLNTLLFIWPVAAKYTYREFAPPATNDAAVVGLGRSVAGPAPGGARTLAHAPSSLARTNTIKPYASSVVKSARLQRALTRNASSAGGDGGGGGSPRSGTGGGRSPSAGGGLTRSGAMGSRALSMRSVRFSEGEPGASPRGGATPRGAATPRGGISARSTTPAAADLARISERPGLETRATGSGSEAPLEGVREREEGGG